MSSISPGSLKLLREILKQGHELERNYDLIKKTDLEIQLSQLAQKFKMLSEAPEADVQKVAKYFSHLKSDLTATQFVHFLVPVERLCQSSPADHDFMVTTMDRISTEKFPTDVGQSSDQKIQKNIPLHVFLDHWRSAFNVGSVFRTADGLGIEKIHLAGYTATPENPLVEKTALGSEKYVPWTAHANTMEALQTLRNEGYFIVGFETSHKSVPLSTPFPPVKTVFVYGNERFGLNDDIIQMCDELRQIPMIGVKNSLNAAVCMALSCYEWKSQWSAQNAN